MTLLAIDWSSVGVKTVQFILSFSILVVLHEMGHFFPAKWFKCRVEKFYLFFNPWFSLWKTKKGETEYGIGWVPFGGYVKISGMVDESMDKEQMKKPPEPWEFRSKPAWQRLIIMVGGVVVNMLLAIVIFIAITWVWGDAYLPPKNLKYGIVADSLGKKVGLQDGDIITAVDNQPLKDATKVVTQLIVHEPKTITVLRNNQNLQLSLPGNMTRQLNNSKGTGFTYIRLLAIVADLSKGSNAEKAGIKKDDVIIAVDSTPTRFIHEVQRELKAGKGSVVNVSVLRKGEKLTLPVQTPKTGLVGIAFVTEFEKLGFGLETKKYSFIEAVPIGVKRCWSTLSMYVTGIKQLFTGKANPNESLGSVISIGKIFPGEWDWQGFWTLTAVFSVILAFMNILPIPALDGGHALFTLVEMVSGRKPGDKFMEYAQTAGMVLLLGLMVYALGLDFWRLFR